ncbi:MAG: hypothetical protein KGL48_11265 [Sphingomonadales bacterium]|nr:hypothetical protein [Sphingomonadales bacterium]MDE2570756.1 hypothetical protein [Sphingomonadales bacterium]
MALVLGLAASTLGGCSAHLDKLSVCSSGKYRYANPNGTSLPSLAVPSVEDLAAPAKGADAHARPPVDAPPRVGAMMLRRPGKTYASC